jgi:hypothetical protein
LNDSVNKDNYFITYSGDTAGVTYDDVNKFYGDFSKDPVTSNFTSNGFISITINSSTYYVKTYKGDNTTDCCSSVDGTKVDDSGSYISAGFAVIKINGSVLRYVKIYTLA